MSKIRIRVGSEDVQLCGLGDRPFPVEMVEREIESSRLRQSRGELDRLPWRVHRCAHADDGRACGILRLFPGPKPSFDDEWVVSDTNREECQHGMRLATAVHVVALHNASIASEEVAYGVAGEVFTPTNFRVTLSAPTFDEFKALFCSYASKVGLVSHDVGLPALGSLSAEILDAAGKISSERPPAPGIDEVMVDTCARVAYDVYRVAFVGDDPMPDFDELDPERRAHALHAARAAVSGTTPEAFHAEWTSELARDGWTAGPELSEVAKTHPNLVPYDELPDEQHLLDGLFFVAATATLRELGRLEAQARLP
jgi:hypothetical protein